MAAQRDRWLRTAAEPALEPDLPICDPHHHLWDRADDRYLLDDLLQDVRSGHNIASTVFIECRSHYRADGPEAMQPIGETEFVEGVAAESARANRPLRVMAGVVGYANLTLGAAVHPVLEGHLAASPTRFRGIRHICVWDTDPAIPITAPVRRPGLLLDNAFRAGFACLKRYNLSFDAWLYYHQLSELAALARAFPDVPIILNHVGGVLGIGPYACKRDEVFQDWKRGIAEVASCHNVVVKLGGLGMPRSGFGWEGRTAPPDSAELATATAPYYLTCIEKFGPARCMFESNFPVDKASYPYGVVWNSFKWMTQGFAAADRAALFHDTATRVYRLA
jgi:predicted TIM-barrel fold metal-dependent hydrolase